MAEQSMISIQHLEKSFGETRVLTDVNIEIQKGEVVVVLGPSGSGKSTMLRCINLLETPTGGHIFIEGQEITDPKVNVNKLREHVGMVFQQFNLFPHLSAKKNVMLAQMKVLKRSKEEAEKIAMERLAEVGLADRADFLPAQLSGLCLRTQAPGQAGYPQAHCLGRRRTGAQPESPQRQAAHL